MQFQLTSYLNSTVPPFYLPRKMKVTFMTFCHYLLNGISFFPFMGHFWKMPLKNKISPFPTLHCSVFVGREDGGFFLFFFNLAAPRMFCFFGRALYRLGKWEVVTLSKPWVRLKSKRLILKYWSTLPM